MFSVIAKHGHLCRQVVARPLRQTRVKGLRKHPRTWFGGRKKRKWRQKASKVKMGPAIQVMLRRRLCPSSLRRGRGQTTSIPYLSFGVHKLMLQRNSVTVTLVGIMQIVTVTDCHSITWFSVQGGPFRDQKTVTIADCHCNRCRSILGWIWLRKAGTHAAPYKLSTPLPFLGFLVFSLLGME